MSDTNWGRMIVSNFNPLQRREYAHVAAFSYAATAPRRLSLITQPVTRLLIDDDMAERTRASRAHFPDVATWIEHLEWKEALFYTHTS